MTTSKDISDLLARVAKRDREAFARLYTATSAKLLGTTLRILKRRDLAEEVLQEVFVKIWDHAGGVLVVEEAGGRVTDIHGRPPEFHHGAKLLANEGMIVTNGCFHDAVVEAIRQSFPGR